MKYYGLDENSLENFLRNFFPAKKNDKDPAENGVCGIWSNSVKIYTTAKDEEDEGTEILGPRNEVVPEQPQQGEVLPEQPQQGNAQLMVRRSARNRTHTEHCGQVIASAHIS